MQELVNQATPPMLLRVGERVEVVFLSDTLGPMLGTVRGTDSCGLLIEREGGQVSYAPWGSILVVNLLGG